MFRKSILEKVLQIKASINLRAGHNIAHAAKRQRGKFHRACCQEAEKKIWQLF